MMHFEYIIWYKSGKKIVPLVLMLKYKEIKLFTKKFVWFLLFI